MTEYDLIRDWTLHGCVDEEEARHKGEIQKYRDALRNFLTADTPGKALEAALYAEQLMKDQK